MNFRDFFNENEKPLDTLIDGCGFCSIFRSVACVGDSLSSGEFEHKWREGRHLHLDMFEYSWGQFMARAMGSKVYNFSRGGMTASEYLDSFAEENGYWDKDKACQAYIIALGVNDVINRGDEVGTVDDIKEDYRENARTFAGQYGAIIQRYKEIQPNAKFFLTTMPRGIKYGPEQKRKEVAELIYAIAEKFDNCYVLDFYKYAPSYDEFFAEKFMLFGHLNPCGYALTAKMMMSYIDYIIRHNIKDFDYVGFIGKEHLMEESLYD